MVKIFGSGSYGKLRAWVTSTIATHTSLPSAHHAKYTDAEVDTIVAAHTAIASAHHAKYTDGEVDAIVLSHKNITSAHHSKYTDAEVDTIVAAHTAIASAHHAKYLDAEAVSAMGAKADANALNHDKYTDSEVDAILSVHTAIASAHHAKYLDAEAVAAVATADDYVKNTGDTVFGDLLVSLSGVNERILGVVELASGKTGIFRFGDDANQISNVFGGTMKYRAYHGSEFYGVGTNNTLMARIGVSASSPDSKFYGNVSLDNNKLQDPKNHAHTALSGTKKLIEIEIGGSPYYFEVSPTKA